MSAAYIEVHFRLDFFMEANNMNPNQTATKEQFLIWVHIVFNIGYLRTEADKRSRWQKLWLVGYGVKT